MSDAKYFHRGKVHELQQELHQKDVKPQKKKKVVKKIIANMTMGNDMLPLSQDLLQLVTIPDLEMKKMIYLYVVTYCKVKPEIAQSALPSLLKDTSDDNPLIRTLAIRTLSNIPVERVMEASQEPLRLALTDKDPLVCKTAATSVAKLFSYNPQFVIQAKLLEHLKSLLQHHNAAVIANAVSALMDIAQNSPDFEFRVDVPTANRLLSALDECNEWCQMYILEAIMTVEPDDPTDAELLIERVTPRLQHSNSGVVIAAVRIMMYLSNYLTKYQSIETVLKKCAAPLITLLNNTPEIQFVALRNIQMILQKHKKFTADVQVFFCKYHDPIYVKLTKLDILSQLANQDTVFTILPELKDYAQEVDVDFVRRAVRAIGRCAVKIESAANKCIEILVEMVQTKIDYVVQEAIIVIKDIFRKYPNRFESIIAILCDNLSNLEEPEAKASMIWIIGQYSDRIENAHDLLEEFLAKFQEDQPIVQLALLTAIVKLFIKRPATGQKLVPKVLKLSTEEMDNPDVRDRGFMYWRMLSTNPVLAKEIVLGEKPLINTESEGMDVNILSRMLYCISKLNLIQQKPVSISAAFANKLVKLHQQSLQVLATRPVSPVKEVAVESSPVQTKARTVAPDFNPYEALIQTEVQVPARQNQTTLGGLPIDLFFGSIDESQTSPDVDIYQKYQGLDDSPRSPVMMNGKLSVVEDNRNTQNTLIDIMNQQQSTVTPAANMMNPLQSNPYAGMQRPVVESAHNPFVGLSSSPPRPVSTINPTNPMNQLQPPLQQTSTPKEVSIASNPNAKIDPFQKTSQANTSPVMGLMTPMTTHQGVAKSNATPSLAGQGLPAVQGLANQMQGMGLNTPIGSPTPHLQLLAPHLNPQQLDVHGHFVRQGNLIMNLTITNRSTVPLYDFAILFNKNTYHLLT
jgi:vesicle coat complex subunit